mmetsp:Transcript_117874/g.279718  ORF Transcript_117874/g.279718 Transcript_117874/m.279718 type:complete len:204 (-) Transcript_117874:437-1048(-)
MEMRTKLLCVDLFQHAQRALLIQGSVEVVPENVFGFVIHNPMAVLRGIVQSKKHAPQSLGSAELRPSFIRHCDWCHNNHISHGIQKTSADQLAVINPFSVGTTQHSIPSIQRVLHNLSGSLPTLLGQALGDIGLSIIGAAGISGNLAIYLIDNNVVRCCRQRITKFTAIQISSIKEIFAGKVVVRQEVLLWEGKHHAGETSEH